MKIVFSFILFLVGVSGFSQFTVQSEGNTITSGHIFNHISTSYPANQLSLSITNTSSETKQYLFRVENMTNANGAGFQICVMTCYYGIAIGNTYPLRTDLVYSLAAGASSGANDIHLLNEDAGSGIYPLDYEFKLYETDNLGSVLGTPFYFTYRYDNAMSVNNPFLQDVKIYPTVSHNVVNIVSEDKPVSYTLYDMYGRLLDKSTTFETKQVLNIESLSNYTYVLKIEDAYGNRATQKIIKN